MKVRVCTDSGCGMTKKEANQLGMDYLPLQVIIDDQSYLDGVTLTTEELYEQMREGAFPQTSQAALGMIDSLFESYEKEQVTDVILVTISNGLSSTNSTVCAAAKGYSFTIHTLDIMTTLAMEKYMAICAQKLVEQQVNPEEIVSRLQESVDHSAGYLVVENLAYLAKGGRLTPTAAKLGSMLKIKPILKVSKETGGKVDAFDKVRTTLKAIKKVCQIVVDKGIDAENYEIVVFDSECEYTSTAIDVLKESIPGITIHTEPICAVIACHTGMESFGIQYMKKVKGC